MILTIPYPDIGSVALQLGPFAIRWYALAYITGLVLGWRYCLALAKRAPHVMKPIDIDDFLVWATLGVVLGGRTGYVLFYRPGFYVTDPLEIVELWHGGMSFHGGCAGVILAMWLFTRRRGIPFLCLADIVACAEPIGQFFGRLANFVNGELWGRPSDVAWSMVFPRDPLQVPRHPSQLYEAGMEGGLMFLLLFLLQWRGLRQRPGAIGGVFLIGYALTRSIGELFREPDAQLGYLFLGTTMGQLLSIPMILGGLWLILRAKKLPQSAAA
jgi:phosphatidylglycerol---prolipoprotein diacylglyceryl transferase